MAEFTLFMLLLAVVLASLKIYKKPELRTAKGAIGVFILYLIFFGIGVNGIWHFLGHVLYAEDQAYYVGWSTGSPFQTLVGVAYLAFGVLGFLCLWEREDFWLATAFGASIFLFGSGLEHLWQIVTRNNLSPGNAGLALYIDLFFPILLLMLIMIHRRLKPRSDLFQ